MSSQDASSHHTDQAVDHLERGNDLKAEGDQEGALAAYDRAAAADPFSPEAHLARAEVLAELLRLPDALAAYQRLLDLKKRSLPGRLGLGRCLLKCGRPAAAGKAFEQALRLDPRNIGALLGHADVLRHLGKVQRAAEAYREVLRLDPESQAAQLALASLSPDTAPATLPPDVVARLFDRFAMGYDEHMTDRLQHRTPQEIYRAVASVVGPGPRAWRILDLGCGTGLCGPLFRDLAQWLAGADLSPEMIAKAEERGIYDELRVADLVSALELEKGSLDLALAADVFVYMGDLSGVFAACARALRPGGRFAFTAEICEDGSFVLQSSLRYAHTQGYLESLAAAHGFSVAHYERYVARLERGIPDEQHLFVLRLDEQ